MAVGYVMMLVYSRRIRSEILPDVPGCSWSVRRLGHGQRLDLPYIGVIFDRQQAGPVLGWTSAIAAYGAFIALIVIGAQVTAGTPQYAMYGFAVSTPPACAELVVLPPARQRVREEP